MLLRIALHRRAVVLPTAQQAARRLAQLGEVARPRRELDEQPARPQHTGELRVVGRGEHIQQHIRAAVAKRDVRQIAHKK